MLTERLQKELEQTYAKGLRRTVDGLRFKTAVRAEDENGKEYLVFASNNYLGPVSYTHLTLPTIA